MTCDIHGIKFKADDVHGLDFGPFDPAAANGEIWDGGCAQELANFIRLTADRKALLDVGALFGIFSLVFTARPGTKAIAIEPSPWAYPVLVQHCRINPDRDIVPLPFYIGERSGATVTGWREWCHVLGYRPHGGVEAAKMVEVAIDDLSLPAWPDALKIDVEGYEFSVLRGAEKLITALKPLIFLECHMTLLAEFSHDPADMEKTLRNWGYRFELTNGKPLEHLPIAGNLRIVCIHT